MKITQNGLDFIEEKSAFIRQQILSAALDSLLGGASQDLLDLLNTLNKPYLSIIEMTFFASYIGKIYNNKVLTIEKIAEFIEEFRTLGARAKLVENARFNENLKKVIQRYNKELL